MIALIHLLNIITLTACTNFLSQINMEIKTHTESNYTLISMHEIGEVRKSDILKHLSFHSSDVFQPGEIMFNFQARTRHQHATYLTIQIGVKTHITFDPEFLQYINHSCDPNVFFDTATMKMICLKPLNPGDEMVFFYPSTEWDMAQPFVCNCSNDNCLKYINGAAHIQKEVLKKYRLTDFILQQLGHNF